MTLQQEFFQQAIATRRSGGTMQDIFNLPPGRTASKHLFSAPGGGCRNATPRGRTTSAAASTITSARSTCFDLKVADRRVGEVQQVLRLPLDLALETAVDALAIGALRLQFPKQKMDVGELHQK